jgi:hypothetical protein
MPDDEKDEKIEKALEDLKKATDQEYPKDLRKGTELEYKFRISQANRDADKGEDKKEED